MLKVIKASKTRKTNCPYESAIEKAILTEKGVRAITKALGRNEDTAWDKAWEWLENPSRTLEQTKAMLAKIGIKI
jgi:hypothetical protein